MSTATTVLQTANQLTTNYDYSKIFLGNNRTILATYVNSGEDPVELRPGRIMGRISASGNVLPLASAASDGSNLPIGVLMSSVDVDASESVEVTIAISGDIAEEKLLFSGSDTLNTVISGRRLRDRIASDTMGIYLVKSTELTEYDNS